MMSRLRYEYSLIQQIVVVDRMNPQAQQVFDFDEFVVLFQISEIQECKHIHDLFLLRDLNLLENPVQVQDEWKATCTSLALSLLWCRESNPPKIQFHRKKEIPAPTFHLCIDLLKKADILVTWINQCRGETWTDQPIDSTVHRAMPLAWRKHISEPHCHPA